jgi:molybdopterin molybdotransferase
MSGVRTRLGVAEAMLAVVDGVTPLAAERVPLADALGRVLAEDAVSPVTLPPWDNAAMDGVAVRAADVLGARADAPVALRLVGAVPAGGAWAGTLERGAAVRIATGAPVPAGADAVVRVEDLAVDDGGTTVRVRDDRDARDANARRNIRPRGEDVREGETAVAAGATLTPAALGVLASVGRVDVPVTRRPRVAIIASGDELVSLGEVDAVRGGRGIVSSNSVALAALVREAGGEPVDLGVVPDDPQALRARFDAAREAACDLVLSTGGVSVGERDHVRDAFAAAGGALRFWRVRVRPGGPLAFGALSGAAGTFPWLGLPGNPVSTTVTFELFARPLLRRLLGDARPFPRALRVLTAAEVTTAVPLTHLLRATLAAGPDGALVSALTGPQGSGLLTSVARADALLVVPEATRRLPAGAPARALLLGAGAPRAESLDPALFEPLA